MANWRANIEHLQEEIKHKQSQIENNRREWTKEGPYQPGDIVEVNGFAHTGKRMIVDTVKVREHYSGWRFEASGRVLNKDGQPGKNVGERFDPADL